MKREKERGDKPWVWVVSSFSFTVLWFYDEDGGKNYYYFIFYYLQCLFLCLSVFFFKRGTCARYLRCKAPNFSKHVGFPLLFFSLLCISHVFLSFYLSQQQSDGLNEMNRMLAIRVTTRECNEYEMLKSCIINACILLVLLHNFIYFNVTEDILCLMCRLTGFRTKINK